MKKLQTLLRLERSFKAIKNRWKFVTFIVLPLIVAACYLLNSFNNPDSLLYKIVFIIFVILIAIFLIWLSSFIFIPIIKSKRAKLYAGDVAIYNSAKGNFIWGSSRMLSFGNRLRAWLNLKELQDTSDYRFMGEKESYVRVQFLSSRCKAPFRDKIKTFSCDKENDDYTLTIPFNDEICTLNILHIVDKKGFVKIFARWVAGTSPSARDFQSAETIELEPNEPALFAYGFKTTLANGEEAFYDETLCSITWIGGNA